MLFVALSYVKIHCEALYEAIPTLLSKSRELAEATWHLPEKAILCVGLPSAFPCFPHLYPPTRIGRYGRNYAVSYGLTV